MITLKKCLVALLAALTALLACTGCGGTGSTAESSTSDSESGVSPAANMTTMQMVRDMGLGINLGNTFEAVSGSLTGGVTSYETSWGSPQITKEMIEGYKKEGFGVLRVPVAWSNMMEPDYTIYEEYLTRVHEVVDWALDAGLYVIMNIHWDNGWWDGFAVESKRDECMKKYISIWKQLCNEFGDENESLMFESLNEEGGWDAIWNHYGSDDSGKAESYALLNEINQTFVDVVRGCANDYNATRHLLIAGYNTDIDLTCDELFQMPDDPQNRCAVSVHYYTPATFCILERDADWGQARMNWGSPRDLSELQHNFDKLVQRFVSQGVPVIIGEYGCPSNKEEASIQKFISNVCKEAVVRDMCPVLWSTPGSFYDRSTNQMYSQSLHDAMFEAVN